MSPKQVSVFDPAFRSLSAFLSGQNSVTDLQRFYIIKNKYKLQVQFKIYTNLFPIAFKSLVPYDGHTKFDFDKNRGGIMLDLLTNIYLLQPKCYTYRIKKHYLSSFGAFLM